MFQRGRAKTGGREPGVPNRLTGAFRDAVLLAYENIGGHETFSQWAADNPTEFYRIAARLIPTEMKLDNAEPDIRVVIMSPVAPQPIEATPALPEE